jgi:hypothetical protein
MELGEIDWMVTDFAWVTRIGVAGVMAVTLTGMLYLVTHNPWASVFACAAGMGWVLLDYCQMYAEERARFNEVVELEKQVVVLRSTLQEMAVMHESLESQVSEEMYKRIRFRRRGSHSLSSSSV